MQRSRMFVVGLVILGLLSLGDLFAPLLTDGEAPPMSVALVLSVLGLASLAAVYGAWRGSKGALITLLVLRSLSALSAVPAFLVPGVPAGMRSVAGIGIALTVIGIVLALSGRRARTAVR